MLNAHEYGSELTSVIYAALLGETDWQVFVDRLNGLIPGGFSTLFFHDLRANEGAMAYVAGMQGREKALEQYEAYYSHINPWMRRVTATPIGKGVIGEAIVSRQEFNRSEYYNDYITSHGLETGVGLTLFRDQNCYFLLSLLTDDRDIDRNLVRANVLTEIAPHLQRVFRYYRSNEFRAATIELGRGVNSVGGFGFILVDDDLKLVKSSSTSESVLAMGHLVGVDTRGRIRFVDPGLQSTLRTMLKRGKTSRETAVFSDTRSGVQFIRIGNNPPVEFFAGPMVAILLRDTTGTASIDPVGIAARYRLSPAETRVLSGIISGLSLAEIASQANVKRETVRSQLKSIFSKTGTASQADIVRLAAGWYSSV